jgi:hypothetical protein
MEIKGVRKPRDLHGSERGILLLTYLLSNMIPSVFVTDRMFL